MTKDEAIRVVGQLERAYPGVVFSHGQRQVWLSYLERRDFEAARAATKRLIEQHPKLPSIAELCGAIRAEERRSLTSTFPVDPEDGPPASRETMARYLDEYRAAIAGPSKWSGEKIGHG